MAEEIIKTIEGVDKFFSQIVVNGESHESTRFVNNTQTEHNNSVQQSNRRSLQGEDVYGVDLNDTLHNFVDRTVAEALNEEAGTRQYADQQLQSSIDVINAMIPSGTSGDNQLTNASDVERDIASAIEALDVPATGGNAKYIKTISESDGKIITETGDISDTVAPSNSNPVTSQAVASACAYCASGNTNVTGASLYTGATLKILFTAQIAGADTSSALTITYNNSPYTVKVAKDGSLVDFTAKASGNAFVYCQAYTTLELAFDGSQFVIMGNPVVISNADFSIMADGSITYKNNVRIRDTINDANITDIGFFIFSVGNNTSNIPASTFTRTKGYIRHYYSGDGNIVQEFTATGYDEYYNAVSEQYIRGSYFDGVNYHFGNWSKL